MKIAEAAKETVLKVGIMMAKMDANTTCLWIKYQPKEPSAIIKMRQTKKKA